MTIDDESDVQATAFWIVVPDRIRNGDYYPGDMRVFETVRNAVRFVMEKLPAHQRGTAEIETAHGGFYRIDEIVSAYRQLR
jgi:hypothetical protein